MRGGIIIVCDPKNLHYRSCWTTMKLYRWIWKGYIPRTEIFRLLYDPPDPNFSSGGMQNRWTFEFYTAYFIWSPQNNYHSTGYRRLHKLPPFAWFMVKKMNSILFFKFNEETTRNVSKAASKHRQGRGRWWLHRLGAVQAQERWQRSY